MLQETSIAQLELQSGPVSDEIFGLLPGWIWWSSILQVHQLAVIECDTVKINCFTFCINRYNILV